MEEKRLLFRMRGAAALVLSLIALGASVLGGVGGGVLSALMVLLAAALLAIVTIGTLSPLVVLLPVLSGVLVFFLTHSLGTTLAVLSYFPAGLLLALSVLRGRRAAETVLAVSLGGLFFGAAAGLVCLIEAVGAVTPDFFTNLFAELQSALYTAFTAVQIPGEDGTPIRLLSDPVAAQYVRMTVSYLPAMAAIFALAIGYFVYKLFLWLLGVLGAPRVISAEDRKINVPRGYAAVFLIALLLGMVMEAGSLAACAAMSIALIMMPALVVIGIRLLLEGVRAHQRGVWLPVILIVLAFFSGVATVLPITAMFAAISVLFGRRDPDQTK